MTKFEQLIEDALSYEEAMNAPRRPLSAKARAAILAGVDEVFGERAKILSEKEMRLVILKFLTGSSATGAEVVEKLKVARLEMEPKGEGVVLGLLYAMANQRLVFPRFDETTATRRYEIEDAGRKLLAKDESTVLGGLALSLSEGV